MRAPVRRAPAARLSARRGAVFIEDSGWEIPASYGDDAAERAAIRDRVAIADITARAKVDVRGRFPPGLALPEDSVPARISSEWLLVLAAPGVEAQVLGALEGAAGPDAMVTDVTHLHAAFALLGPDVPAVLERTTSWGPSTLAPGEAAAAPIVEVPAVIVRRDLPIPVVELLVATESARYAWEELSRVVGALRGQPVGWQALRAEGWR